MRIINEIKLKDYLLSHCHHNYFNRMEITVEDLFNAIDFAEISEMGLVARSKGEWLEADPEGVVMYDIAYRKCSCCDKRIYLAKSFNFCPNCGADMREETET